jgi:hypothetical protein
LKILQITTSDGSNPLADFNIKTKLRDVYIEQVGGDLVDNSGSGSITIYRDHVNIGGVPPVGVDISTPIKLYVDGRVKLNQNLEVMEGASTW